MAASSMRRRPRRNSHKGRGTDVMNIDVEISRLEKFVTELREADPPAELGFTMVTLGSVRRANEALAQLINEQFAQLDQPGNQADGRITRLLTVQEELQEALALPTIMTVTAEAARLMPEDNNGDDDGQRMVTYFPEASQLQRQPERSPAASSASTIPSAEPVPIPVNPSGPEQCLICFDEHPPEEMRCLLSCGVHRYCHQCMRLHFTTLINSAEVTTAELTCPNPDCQAIPAEYELDNLVEFDVYQKYLQFVALALVKDDKNTRWCLNTDCRQPITWDPRETKVVCPACHAEFCFDCSRALHPGLTCDGVSLPDAEKTFQEWRATKGSLAKECKSCHNLIEKNDGCNHITCRCSYQWCWLCEEEYAAGHYGTGSCDGFQFAPANTLAEAIEYRRRREEAAAEERRRQEEQAAAQLVEQARRAAAQAARLAELERRRLAEQADQRDSILRPPKPRGGRGTPHRGGHDRGVRGRGRGGRGRGLSIVPE